MKSSLFLKIFTLSGFLILITVFVGYRAGFFTSEENDSKKNQIETKFSEDEMTEAEEMEIMSSSKSSIVVDEEIDLIPSSKSGDILEEDVFISDFDEDPTNNSDEIEKLSEKQVMPSSKTLIITPDYYHIIEPPRPDGQSMIPRHSLSTLTTKRK